MVEGQNILVVGARSGGYGASIARAAAQSGARVFGTSLTPEDPREQAFFHNIGTVLIDKPLRFDFDRRSRVFDALADIEQRLKGYGVERLDAVIHTIAGGFPRQPSVMKAVSDILKGRQTFFDMATAVKRNVYYVNGGSFEDLMNGLPSITDESTQYLALTYRGNLPYFISHTKRYLEKIAERAARKGKLTVIAALPEAWTESSQFFTGIELAVLYNYLTELKGQTGVSEDIAPFFNQMVASLAEIEGLDRLAKSLESFYEKQWATIIGSSDIAELSNTVRDLFNRLRNEGMFTALRRAVEAISDFVRDASGLIIVREFIAGRRYEAGDVRQIFSKDLMGRSEIGKAKPREELQRKPAPNRKWLYFCKDDIRSTLSMYGKNFLFVDRVIMEDGEVVDGKIGFARFTVPTPEENPILKDHFVGMPLFGGHLQMEAVAQLGTFMMLQVLKGRRLFPILTGTEFPDLNTMAPPGETLTMVGVIRLRDKRDLMLEAFIENRYARSKGIVRGMILNERVFRKMLSSFRTDGLPSDDEEYTL
jgi:3-hydroxymyristoyl/3-hydroxydecanoyl-(acyl carrier protein) dehydratase